jgi:hypothetical protein
MFGLARGAALLCLVVNQPKGGWAAGAAAQDRAGSLGVASIQMTADVYGHPFPRGDDAAKLAAAEKAFLAM